MVITGALLKEMQINYRLVQRKFDEVADSDLDTLDSKLQNSKTLPTTCPPSNDAKKKA